MSLNLILRRKKDGKILDIFPQTLTNDTVRIIKIKDKEEQLLALGKLLFEHEPPKDWVDYFHIGSNMKIYVKACNKLLDGYELSSQ